MTSSSPDGSYKVITKQIFISQETLHRVLILSFADPKTRAAKKACKRYEGYYRGLDGGSNFQVGS